MTERLITLDQYEFEIIVNFREGFDSEALMSRYSEILLKYDYILGDWGYGQLRLKGFFDDRNAKATYETKISTLQDYLYEYCNFGCAHFILKKLGKVKQEQADTDAKQESPAADEIPQTS